MENFFAIKIWFHTNDIIQTFAIFQGEFQLNQRVYEKRMHLAGFGTLGISDTHDY